MDFKIENGDLIIGNDITTITGNAQLAQSIAIELTTWKKEWFANFDYGVDWEKILGSKQGKTKIIYEVTTVIKKYSKVKKISKFDWEVSKTREYKLTITLLLQDESSITVEV